MFRILLVEDILNTLEQLRELLQEVFPNLLIETASTVAEGQNKIKSSQTFDIAILDFKLPVEKGLTPEIDKSLCQEIKSRMPQTLVIHITAFHEDDAVNKHIARYHAGKNDPSAELIQKGDDWPEKLISKIKAYLIEQQLYNLFEKQAEAAGARKVSRGSGSFTHMLAALSRDIVAYWSDLDDPTKAKIREYFETAEDKQQVRVTPRLRR